MSRNSCPGPGKREILWPPTRPLNDFFQPSVSRSNCSRKWRSRSGCSWRLRGSRAFQNFLQKRFGCLAVGMGIEVQDDPMTQHRGATAVNRRGSGADVPESKRGHGRIPSEPGLLAANCRNECIVGDLRRTPCAGLRRHNQLDRIVLHMRGDDYLPSKCFQTRDLRPVQHLPQFHLLAPGRHLDNAVQIVAGWK